jgi:hypothetical protein
MDYSICKALSYNMEDIPVALVMYDIMCQYRVHFKERVENSPELSLPSSLELRMGIGLFHIHGHQDSCLPRFSPSYIPGAKQVDGEIIETLWAPLNNISRSIRGMSLAHRQEVLDAHINHSNWKKLVQIGMCYLTYICTYVADIIRTLQSHPCLRGGSAWNLAWMPVLKHLRLLVNTSSTKLSNGSRRTKLLRVIDAHSLHLWIYMILSRRKVWTKALTYLHLADAHLKLHLAQLSNNSLLWRRMRTIPFMVRHPGFHVA